MTITFDMAKQVLTNQPFSAFLGATLTHFDDTMAEITLPMRDEFKQQNGFVHGGLISYLADNTLTFAGGIALGAAVLTAEYKINYLKPGNGQTLVARGTVISAGKRQAVCRCDVFAIQDGEETLCATAIGTIVATG